MRPTLRQLQYLVAIADLGRFGEAAKSLNVSQSSLSAQIAEMEDGLGVRLFERGRHGALLTPIGQEILGRARIILREVEELRSVARQGDAKLSGRVHLGVLPSIGPYLLPVAARQLHQKYPQLRLVVREERTVDLEDGLLNGRLDLIISTPRDHRTATSVNLFRERLWICAAPDDPLSQVRGPVTLSELAGKSLLSLGHGHRLSQLVNALAEQAGAVVSTEYEGTSLDAVRQMASMGAGIAVLPSLYALSEAQRDPEFVIRPFVHPDIHRDIALCWRPTSPLSDSYQLLSDALIETASGLLKGDI